MRAALPALGAVIAAGALAAVAGSAPLPKARHCPLFPRSFAANRALTAAPVRPDSDAILASTGLDTGLHADFGSGRYAGNRIGIPYDVVSRRTARSRVAFDYADESDRGPYPIPAGVHIEGGGDRHALLVDADRCRLFELYALRRRPGGGWSAGSRPGCGPRAGRAPTPRACRSCRCWRATTRSRAGTSTTRCA